MIKKLIPLVIVLAILIGAAVTNPSKTEYVSWAKEQAINTEDNAIAKGVLGFFGDSVIDSYTTSKNYFIFSLYETSVKDGESIKVVGIFNNFIPYSNTLSY